MAAVAARKIGCPDEFILILLPVRLEVTVFFCAEISGNFRPK